MIAMNTDIIIFLDGNISEIQALSDVNKPGIAQDGVISEHCDFSFKFFTKGPPSIFLMICDTMDEKS